MGSGRGVMRSLSRAARRTGREKDSDPVKTIIFVVLGVIIILIKLYCLYCCCRRLFSKKEPKPARPNSFAISMPAPPPPEVRVDPVIKTPVARQCPPSGMPDDGHPCDPCSTLMSGANLTAPKVAAPNAMPPSYDQAVCAKPPLNNPYASH